MSRLSISFVLTALVLCACVSSPIQTMTPKEAVQFGSDLYYTTPNYAFDSTTKIEEVRVDATPSEKLQNFNEIANRLIQRLSFDVSGVIDTPNQLYQMTPTYHYKAKNMQASLSIPMVYDANQQSFLADLSAFDVILNRTEHIDKYSRFDVGSADVNDKGKKLIGIIQKYTRKHYEDMDNAVFSELPLSSEDRRVNVVRKIQVSDAFKIDALYSTDMMKEIFEIMRSAPKKQEELSADSESKSELERAFRTEDFEQARHQAGELIDPKSRHTSVLSFDKEGRIVQSQSLLDIGFKQPKSDEPTSGSFNGMHIKMSGTFNMTSIGQAKLADPPTVDNTVDGLENLKGSLVGKVFGKLFTPKKHGDERASEIGADETTQVGEAVEPVELKNRSVKKSKNR